MDTNYQMLKKLLEVYEPKQRGLCTKEEIELIKATLHLEEMDILALRNMRDFTVCDLGHSTKLEDWDRMSAIVYVIDTQIIKNGGEV